MTINEIHTFFERYKVYRPVKSYKKLEKMLAQKRQSIKVAGYFRANGYIITSSGDFAT